MPRFLAALVLCAAAAAQIPHGHLIYVHRSTSSTVPAIGIVDPTYGTPTPIVPLTGLLTTHGSKSVAIDPLAPNVLYSITGLSTSISANVPVLTLTGNRYVRTNLQANLGVPGMPSVLRWAPGYGLLLLGRGGPVNKMFLRNMATGTVTPQPTSNLLPLSATDMTFLNGKAYASSEGDGSATAVGTIVEWDLVANTDRVVGNTYPPILSLAEFAGQLIAGDGNGDLHLIDPVTGTASLFASTGLGMITSIAVDPLMRVFVVAETPGTWTIYNIFASVPGLYSSPLPIDDLAVGPTPVATMLVWGNGCTGSNNQAPVLGFTAPPALGTTFGVTLAGALSTTGAFLVFGTSRVQDPGGPLPRDLAGLGMPGCTQYTDVVGTLFALTNGAGAAQSNFTLPNNPAFAAVRIPMQWACLDAAANTLGVTTSSPGECYVY